MNSVGGDTIIEKRLDRQYADIFPLAWGQEETVESLGEETIKPAVEDRSGHQEVPPRYKVFGHGYPHSCVGLQGGDKQGQGDNQEASEFNKSGGLNHFIFTA